MAAQRSNPIPIAPRGPARGRGKRGGVDISQSMPPAAPVIGSLPAPKLAMDMPEMQLPDPSPQASSVLKTVPSGSMRAIAASAPARSAMAMAGRRGASMTSTPGSGSARTAMDLLSSVKAKTAPHVDHTGSSKAAADGPPGSAGADAKDVPSEPAAGLGVFSADALSSDGEGGEGGDAGGLMFALEGDEE